MTPTITSTPRPQNVTTYNYDNNGNLVSESTGGQATTYTYDFENRLSKIRYADGTRENYQYDYAGELISKSSTKGVIHYVYGMGVAPVYETISTGPPSATKEFIQINGKTVGESSHGSANSQAHFYHTDGTGNVLGVSDSTGTVVETTTYDPFGVVLANASSGSYNTEYQYVGAYGVRHVPTSGNQPGNAFDHSIMGVRMYDAGVGRFLSEDPLGFDGGDINLYRYALDNPMLFNDPTGLRVRVCCRPLNVPGLGIFKHCFISTDYGVYSLIQENGHGVKMFNYSADNPNGPGVSCTDATGGCGGGDRCIATTFNSLPPTKFYGYLLFNSNTFVADLLSTCQLKYVFPSGASGSYQP